MVSRTNIICVACPRGCRITIESRGDKIKSITGYGCKKGKEYAREEFKNPTRILPTTVRVKNGELPLVSVKTESPIPKKDLLPAMKETVNINVKAPVNIGDIIVENIAGTGVNLIATNNVGEKCK